MKRMSVAWESLGEYCAINANGVMFDALVIPRPDGDDWCWTLTERVGGRKREGKSTTRKGARAAVYRHARLDGYILGLMRKPAEEKGA